MASKTYKRIKRQLNSFSARKAQQGSIRYQERHTASPKLLQLYATRNYVLRNDQKFIFEAFYFEKRSTSDIGKQLGKSSSAVVTALKIICRALESGIPSKLFSKGKALHRFVPWDICKEYQTEVGRLVMQILERRYKHHQTNKEIAAEFDLSEAEASMIAMVFGRLIRKLSNSTSLSK